MVGLGRSGRQKKRRLVELGESSRTTLADPDTNESIPADPLTPTSVPAPPANPPTPTSSPAYMGIPVTPAHDLCFTGVMASGAGSSSTPGTSGGSSRVRERGRSQPASSRPVEGTIPWTPMFNERGVPVGNNATCLILKIFINFQKGSKQETFFDSKAWLDSDCEDDFYSVNGDFTPSRGSTPVHHLSIPVTPQPNKSEPSPNSGTKKLFDLLRETFESENMGNEQNSETYRTIDDYKPFSNKISKSLEGCPYLSGTNSVWSSETTPSRDSNKRKERTARPKNCCFPNLMPNRNIIDMRKSE